VIRRAEATDREWMIATGELVFAELGDYRTVISSWLDAPGILAWIDEDPSDGERRGFGLLGFYLEDNAPIADLLALAVLPEFQGQQIGTALLRHVLQIAVVVGPKRGIPHLRLTVAEDNLGAQRLYLKHQFVIEPIQIESYGSGRGALRMTRVLT